MPPPSSDHPLSRIFREHWQGGAPVGEAGLETTLRGLFSEGERAWPELSLSPEAFVSHLASRCGARPRPDPFSLGETPKPPPQASPGETPKPPPQAFAGVRAADLFLACACATRVRGAVEAFDRVHLSRVGAFLARLKPSPELVDEVRQMLREKLLVAGDGRVPRIAEYDGRGALGGWVRVIALRAALDLQQGQDVAKAPKGRRSEPGTGDPEIAYLKQRYREAFNEAFRGAVEELDAEPRELLRLHVIEGETLDALAVRLGVHRATIARRIAAAKEAVAVAARRRLRDALGVGEGELESLVRVVRSQIDVSLTRLL